MDRKKKALLIGLVLGDGHLNPRSGVCLEITHSVKQKSYIENKAKLIAKLLNCKIPNLYHRKDDKHDEYKLSKGHRYFRILYKWLYRFMVFPFSTLFPSFILDTTLSIYRKKILSRLHE